MNAYETEAFERALATIRERDADVVLNLNKEVEHLKLDLKTANKQVEALKSRIKEYDALLEAQRKVIVTLEKKYDLE